MSDLLEGWLSKRGRAGRGLSGSWWWSSSDLNCKRTAGTLTPRKRQSGSGSKGQDGCLPLASVFWCLMEQLFVSVFIGCSHRVEMQFHHRRLSNKSSPSRKTVSNSKQHVSHRDKYSSHSWGQTASLKSERPQSDVNLRCWGSIFHICSQINKRPPLFLPTVLVLTQWCSGMLLDLRFGPYRW